MSASGADGVDRESLLEQMLAATLEGLADHDLLAGTTAYSLRWRLMLGYDAEVDLPVTPTLWLELTHPQDRAQVEELWQGHVGQGWPFQHTWRMKHRHGGYRWIRCRSALRLTDDGLPARALSLFADATDEVEEHLRHRALVEAIPDTLLRIAADGRILDVRPGRSANERRLLEGARLGDSLARLEDAALATCLRELVAATLGEGASRHRDWTCSVDRSSCHFELRATPSGSDEVVFLIRDVTELKSLEQQLQQAQKLESIGQLAAGIAHEINTPTQFVGDNTRFLEDTFDELAGVLSGLRALIAEESGLPGPDSAWRSLREACANLDLDFVLQEVPRAIGDSLSGLERVSSIVGAMKEFSHPGGMGRTVVDINRALQSTVTVARNEWKYVAEVELDLEQGLPAVCCLAGEINQVFLNIIVNAAHAIAKAREDGREELGRITLRTRSEEGGVVVSITDTGCGIPEAIRSRVFDPFFTTKGVGKGTGQGLAIAHSVIRQKHGGRIDLESTVGVGTTFHVHIPFGDPAAAGTGAQPAHGTRSAGGSAGRIQ